MERQGDHALHLAKVNVDQPVVAGAFLRRQGPIVLLPAMLVEVFPGLLVRDPNGGKGGALGGHHVDAHAVFHAQPMDAAAHHLQDLVFREAVGEAGAHQRQRHVHGPDTRPGPAGEAHRQNGGTGDVVGAAHQLLGQLTAAFADAHGA